VSQRLRFGARLDYDPALPSILVPVRVSVGSAWVETEAKLDTGSSHCVFAREVGDALGLEVEAGQLLQLRTVTGWFDAFGHAVTLGAVEVELDVTVYFAAAYGFPVNVLGRRGWIERLRPGLVDYDGLLLASHYDDPQDDEDA
jgi:hypothetical protein